MTTEKPDLSAFWLYPDWDGPLEQPFWMRSLKVDVEWPIDEPLPTHLGEIVAMQMWTDVEYRRHMRLTFAPLAA